MHRALMKGKMPMSMVERIPKCSPMKAATAAVLTGPVKKGQSRRKGPRISSRYVPTVIVVSSVGKPSRTSPSGRAMLSRLRA